MGEHLAVTGGNGTIGRAVVEEGNEAGYCTVSLDREQTGADAADRYIRTDLLDPGEVYGALATAAPDAVVHMGTIPGPGSDPGARVYRSNALSAYHVLEAAAGLGIDTVVLASSINVVGTVMQDPPPEIQYLPWDEAHPLSPREPYGLGKQTMEVVADGFGRQDRPPHTIASLRYPGVSDDTSLRASYVEGDAPTENLKNPGQRDDLFTYIHLRDAASIAQAAVEAEFRGHERFWAVADDTTVDVPSADLVERFWPDVDCRRDLVGYEALVENGKAETLLDWEPDYSWRKL